MSSDAKKTKKELIEELGRLRDRLAATESTPAVAATDGPVQGAGDLARYSLERAADALFWIDPDGRFTYVNEAACRSLGYTREELLGMNVFDIDPHFNPDVWPRHWEAISQAGSMTADSQHRTKDGRLFPVEIVANFLRFGGKEYNVAFARDVTSRKDAEENLRFRERFERLIVAISTRFIHLRADEIDHGLEQALGEIGQFTGVDRGQIILFDDDGARLSCFVEWTAEGVPTLKGELQSFPADVAPWMLDKLARGEVIAASYLDRLPPSDARLREMFDRFGIRSWIDVPIMRGPSLLGFLGLVSLTENRSWSDDVQALLRVCGEIVANALERKRMESDLRESRERLELALHAAQLGMWEWFPQTGRLYRSERQAEMLGYSPEETDPDLDFFRSRLHPDDVAPTLGALRDHLEGESELFFSEHRLRKRDGDYIWLQDRGKIVARDADGQPFRLAGVTQDITERKQAESALHESERRLRSVIDNAPIVLWAVDSAGRFTLSEGKALAALGLRPGEVVGQSVFELYADNHAVIDAVKRALAGEPVHSTTQVQGKSYETRYAPQIDDQGRVTGTIGISVDITERKRAEQERIRLSTAVEQAAEAVMLTDTDGKIEYVNPAFERITGFSRGQVLGRDPGILDSGAHDGTFLQELWETIRSGRVWTGRLVHRKADGGLVEQEATISPIHDTDGTQFGFVWVARDVTEQVQLESLLRQSQKMEAVGQLAGGVAHDFNNILQVIRGYNDLALELASENEALRLHLEQIMGATDRAASLVRQLLTFSRREKLKTERLDLDETILGTVKLLGRVLGEHIDLNFRSSGGAKTIQADRGQIEQILMNLCVNARDALPRGGTITISSAEADLDRAFVEHHPWAREGSYAVLAVSDTGGGIPDQIREHIFEPFFTTKEVGQGTGLGLATVYAIAKRHEGLIDVESIPGTGTTFRVYLPTTTGSAEPRAGGATRPWPAGGTETILLAEDDDLVRGWVSRILGAAGYRVLAARDGAAALELFHEHEREIDLALLDVVMPGKSGREVQLEVKRRRPDLPVIFSTGYSYDVLDPERIPGADLSILNKPYDAQSILERIRAVLDGKGRK